MKKPKRKQHDDDQDQYSAKTALDFTGTVDKTRQEFGAETDASTILSRYGVPVPGVQRVPATSLVNYDIDLQGALNSVRNVREAWTRLPAHLRSKYPSWQALADAIERGELTTIEPPAEEQKKQDATPVVPPKAEEKQKP